MKNNEARHAERWMREAPQTLASPRFLALGAGTLAYTAAGGLDLFGGASGHPLGALGTLALLIGGTVLLVRGVSLPPTDGEEPRRVGRGRDVTRRLTLAALALCALLSLAVSVGLAGDAGDTSIYDSDAAAFNAYNAELVLRGQNPYTADAAFWDALRRFPSVGASPLRAGRYAGSAYGPSLPEVVADAHYEQTHPSARGPEYAPASLHSYPALAFLIYVPGVWAGLPTTYVTSLLLLLTFLLVAGWGARRGQRTAAWLLLAASPLVAFWTLRGSFEVVALLPALLAWRLLDRRWLSPALLGLACAVKQIVWPLVPLYTILVWRRNGPRAALTRLGITVLAFLAPNTPFLLAAPSAWARSMLLPVTLPLFPSGVGVVGLARAGLLPLLPSAVYALLELTALGALAVWVARSQHPHVGAIALVLGLTPFALSWHSLFPYFMCIPTVAVASSLVPGETAMPTSSPNQRDSQDILAAGDASTVALQ